MNQQEILDFVLRRLANGRELARARPVTGGSLNYVWRIEGAHGSVIAKQAPAYVASAPEIPLDPSRVLFEAKALALFAPDGPLAGISSALVRPPELLDVAEDEWLLIEEDLGDLVDLGDALGAGMELDEQMASLGGFISQIHLRTLGDTRLAADFDNAPIQHSRNELQYRGVAQLLEAAGVSEAGALGARAAALGARLLEPGVCLIMGDLWPRSVLLNGRELRLIDWEFCHFGSPLQDVAHLLAHLHMRELRAESEAAAEAARRAQREFLTAYASGLSTRLAELWTSEVLRDAEIHFACELLMRTLGPFRSGYLYDGLPPDAEVTTRTVETAVEHLHRTRELETFGLLAQ